MLEGLNLWARICDVCIRHVTDRVTFKFANFLAKLHL